MRIGPKYKIARRLGEKIFPKTQTTKFAVSGTGSKSGGKRGRKNVSEYGQQLIEKQKARFSYGITEKQFSKYVKEANNKKGVSPASVLYSLLETRLDNVVFRMGLVNSRFFARQIVSHGHIMVNNKKVTIPSYRVKEGDVISIRPQSKDNGIFKEENQNQSIVPTWIQFDEEKKIGTIKGLPVLGEGELNINFSSILEFYSRV